MGNTAVRYPLGMRPTTLWQKKHRFFYAKSSEYFSFFNVAADFLALACFAQRLPVMSNVLNHTPETGVFEAKGS
jgi:hypothetical protein